METKVEYPGFVPGDQVRIPFDGPYNDGMVRRVRKLPEDHVEVEFFRPWGTCHRFRYGPEEDSKVICLVGSESWTVTDPDPRRYVVVGRPKFDNPLESEGAVGGVASVFEKFRSAEGELAARRTQSLGWKPTHRILLHGAYGDPEIPVMLTESGAAYTRQEWETTARARFGKTTDTGEWVMDGQPFNGMVTKVED